MTLPIETVVELLILNHQEEGEHGEDSYMLVQLTPEYWVTAYTEEDLRKQLRTYLETLAENANAAG